jgi:DNA modification methylase
VSEPDKDQPNKPGESVSQPSFSLPDQDDVYRMPTRFGTVPVARAPLGYLAAHGGYEHLFPRVRLPFQVVDHVSLGESDAPPNRLFFGDNLHVMRQLPTESIDLIYLDPPFFSGRQYNVIFGDRNEVRSFSDIWEGGLDGYLVWLNARLLEMKRLLTSTGSLFVHLDWHAAHYVKVELDKIFGYDHFQNEIVWCYRGGGVSPKRFGRKHDVILWYTKGPTWHFVPQYTEYSESTRAVTGRTGRRVNRTEIDLDRGAHMPDWWTDINSLQTWSPERIGYPTQKPVALVRRIIDAACPEGGVVADFFCGGGTSLVAAQTAGRPWIGADQSRVAVAITADRLATAAEGQTDLDTVDVEIRDFTVEHWGIYDISHLRQETPEGFRSFVIAAFGGRLSDVPGPIHGYRGNEPLHVGSADPDSPLDGPELADFAKEVLATRDVERATVLAWGFTPVARELSERLARRQVRVRLVRLNLVPIETPEFREHVSTKGPSYEHLLSFVLPPIVSLRIESIGSRKHRFDASATVPANPNARIVSAQWDFDYSGVFSSTDGFELGRKRNEPLLVVEYTFPRRADYQIAVRVQDDLGGERTEVRTVHA